MKLKPLMMLLIILCSGLFVNAQKLAQEKIVELTGKSRNKGFLGDVIVDDANKKFDMVFITKSTEKKVKMEIFTFDFDFNLIDSRNEEVEYTKAKEKVKRLKYRGVDYEEIYGVTAQGNMIGKLVLKKIKTVYSYNWWNGRYEVNTYVVDKEKPKEIGEDGDKSRKMYYTAHRELLDKGELLVCALINKGIKTMSQEGSREYMLMRVNQNLDITDKKVMNFDHPQALVFNGQIESTDDWVMIFAPYGGQGYGKISDPDPVNYTFIKINNSGDIVERFNFKSKCNEWAIYDAYVIGNDMYLYGPGNINKPDKNYTKAPYCISTDYISSGMTPETRYGMLENEKYTHLQVVKLSNGKAEFVTAAGIDEINSKGIKPPSQKKLREFDGKRFVLNGVSVSSNGTIYITGQDFKMDKVGDVQGRVYKDLMMFQFNADGSFARYYGVENTAKGALLAGAGTAKSFPAESIIYESPDGKSVYWNVFLCQEIDSDCHSDNGYQVCNYTPLYQGKMGKIDIASGSVSDFETYGGEDFFLYIDLSENRGKDVPYFMINGGTQVVYVARERKGGIKGNERWGTNIWFGKFDPTL